MPKLNIFVVASSLVSRDYVARSFRSLSKTTTWGKSNFYSVKGFKRKMASGVELRFKIKNVLN